ncbi:MAG: flagellar basal body-associated FliL family protein [Actinomycetota bacterium]
MGKLLKNKKILIILVVVLVGGLFAAKTFLLKPPPIDEKKLAKEPGPTYVIATPFVVNLAGDGSGIGHFVKADIALRISKLSAAKIPAGHGSKPVAIEEEPEIRDIVNEVLASKTAGDLLSAHGRDEVKKEIVKLVNKETEIKIVDVYYNSIAVQ